jgi:hypothetical protein
MPIAQVILTTDEVLQRGLELVGFNQKRQASVRRKKNRSRFRTHYTAEPNVVAVLLVRLQTTDNAAARISFDKVGVNKTVSYFFAAIHLLAKYPTKEEAEGVFKWSDRMWSSWTWDIVKKISKLKPEIIIWPSWWGDLNSDSNDEAIFIISVDGAHFRIEEPTHENFSENTIYYSHKFKQAALDYEIAVSIYTDEIVWAAGPYPAGVNDITVFWKRLLGKIMESRASSGIPHRAIGDKGYRGPLLQAISIGSRSACNK